METKKSTVILAAWDQVPLSFRAYVGENSWPTRTTNLTTNILRAGVAGTAVCHALSLPNEDPARDTPELGIVHGWLVKAVPRVEQYYTTYCRYHKCPNKAH